ncbi:MAG: hypothetical protein RI101_04925 [Nitrospira sp.]|jgi:hypothetical protein|nr:hypothetical protein [Nitrospira sp.]
MTKTPTLLLATLCLLATAVILPVPSQAATGLTVVIQGTQLTAGNCTDFPNDVVLSNCDGTAKSYSGITIEKKPGAANPAMAKVTDGNNDSIWVENVLITASTEPVNGDIVFFAQFDAPPTANPSANPPVQVQFDRTANGSMTRGSNAAKDDWFKVTGWVNDNNTGDNEIATYQQKSVCCSIPASYGNFNLATSETWSSGLAGSRVMKGEFWFYQKYAGDKLTLSLVEVKSAAIANVPNFGQTGVFDGYAERFLKP